MKVALVRTRDLNSDFQIINESVRLENIVPGVFSRVPKDVQIKGEFDFNILLVLVVYNKLFNIRNTCELVYNSCRIHDSSRLAGFGGFISCPFHSGKVWVPSCIQSMALGGILLW